MNLARHQAAYDSACMAYGRNKARSFLEGPDPLNYAFVSTFTTDGATLNTFAHYSSETQGQVKYYQCPTSSSFLISIYEDFKKSRRLLRNVQGDAKQTLEKLRDGLNKKWLENQQLDKDKDWCILQQATSAPGRQVGLQYGGVGGRQYVAGRSNRGQVDCGVKV
jgi:hypothetical protein